MKPIMPVKAADISVRGVNDFPEGNICQDFSEGREVMNRYRINDVDFMTRGNLYEAELFRVVVKTIGFCVKGNGM